MKSDEMSRRKNTCRLAVFTAVMVAATAALNAPANIGAGF